MKRLLFALCLLPQLVFALVPSNTVYPNSGGTEANTDQQTNVIDTSDNPIDRNSGIQEEQEAPRENDKNFLPGPYDHDGNYRVTPKKADQAPTG